MLKHTTFALAMLLAGSALAEPVKIGLQPWLGYGPLWVAAEKGFFEKNGLEVELNNFSWDQDLTAALASGNLDVVAASTNTLITNFNQGSDQTGFLVMDLSFEADAILAGNGITKIEDLRGKTVAFESGSTGDLLLNYALKTHGMTIADVTHVPMGSSEAGLALISGQVDVAVTYEPYISAALTKAEGFGAIYTAAEKPGLISDVLTASAPWIAANPDKVQALIRSWDDAINFIRANPEEGSALIAKAVGSPMEEFEPAFKGVRLYTVAENVEFLKGDYQSTMAEIAAIMQTANPDNIKTIPTPEQVLSLDALYEVAK